jgi:hypothetical protein
VRNGEWSAQVCWDEACARSAGRRRINAIRQLRARVRQRAVLRRLRALGDFTRRGVQRQLAREFGVSASVICRDVQRLLARSDARPAQPQRVPRRREVRMPEKISLRLSAALYKDVQQAARRRHTTPSAIVRLALQRALDQSTPARTPSAPPPNDALEQLLARCPADVQLAVRRVVDGTGLGVADVLRALVITACEPKQTP